MASDDSGKPQGTDPKVGGLLSSRKPRCGRKARSTGEPCRRIAGHGTARLGEEGAACRYHGGAGGRPIKHGLYSSIIKRLREFVKANIDGASDATYAAVYQELQQDPEINSLAQEIALLRTCTIALFDVLSDPNAQGLAGPFVQKLPPAMRLELIAESLERTVRAVYKKVMLEEGLALRLTPANLEQISTVLGRAVSEHISDPKVLAAIGASIGRLLGTGPAGAPPRLLNFGSADLKVVP